MAGERILIVDDTPVNLKLTRALLSSQGYEVLTASNAEEGLDLLWSRRPALVLTDLQLPGMDGLEFTRRIKSDGRSRDTVVVALSAFADGVEKEFALEAGCDGCIAKPIDTRAFANQVREYLERHAAGRGAALAAAANPLSETAIAPLRSRFLEESTSQARSWAMELDGELSAEPAAHAVHQWIGAAGLLGYPEISEMSRELEAVLRTRPVDAGEVRDLLEKLLGAFAARRAERKRE